MPVDFNVENPIGELRRLKGAPLSVLLALLLAGQPVTSEWLETVTGYSDKPITKATDFLREIGYIRPCNGSDLRQRGWCLASGAYQFPLIHNLSTGNDKNRKNSDSQAVNTINYIGKEIENESKTVVVTNKNRNFSDSQIDDRLLALRMAGIFEPTAGKLALLEWVDHEYVIGQYLRMRREIETGNKKVKTGLLIYWIKQHDPVPESIQFDYGDEDPLLHNLQEITLREDGEWRFYYPDFDNLHFRSEYELT